MLMILFVSNSKRASKFTGLLAGLLIASYVTFESLSGFGMNPGQNPRLRDSQPHLDRAVDLYLSADRRHVGRRRSPSRHQGIGSRSLLQTPPLVGRALHVLRSPGSQPMTFFSG